MSDPLEMLFRETLEDTPNAISLQELVDGALPCNSQDGPRIDLFGQEAAPASPSPAQESRKVKQTNATSGPYGSTSSASAALQRSLESRLAARLPMGGLTMFIKGWKQKVTPAGRQYCQLAVSARPISETDCGLWGTPLSNQANGEPEAFLRRKRESVARGSKMGICLSDLNMQVKAVAMWPTVTTNDATGSQYQYGKDKKKILKLTGQVMAMWPTPNANKHTKNSKDPQKMKEGGVQTTLADATWIASKAMRPTPSTRDYKDTGSLESSQFRKCGKERNDTLGRVAYGSAAPMENKGSLNPAFPCWLMGYPTEWGSCADMVTLLCLRQPRNSSKLTEDKT